MKLDFCRSQFLLGFLLKPSPMTALTPRSFPLNFLRSPQVRLVKDVPKKHLDRLKTRDTQGVSSCFVSIRFPTNLAKRTAKIRPQRVNRTRGELGVKSFLLTIRMF